jgi:uncharacterized membrane protein (DUF485 family)|tara:strand:- start:3143 stop:3607 length:465 start_codon:yes stop_codon:yes gene_type:complete
MLNLILILHSLLRWAAIAFGLVAIGRAAAGLTKTPTTWIESDAKFSRLFAISLDVQMLLGILMYLFFSTITTSAFQNMGEAMGNSVVRFWIVEHPTIMLVALVFAHIGVARARKMVNPNAKHRTTLIFLGISLALILIGTPWPGSPAERPLLPF